MKYEKQEVELSEVAKNGKNIALSKSSFINHVENNLFKEVDITSFSSAFALIEYILQDYTNNKANEIEISSGAYLRNYSQ
ncbi:hypothetical protein [Bacillus zhangzhouensis]|uniref:hypothetical protein n=1 Tax=Bacillus zhangzhouensis TaxID=1178540 RepID=UPI0020BE945F|nr:hypothetical protein [Bacillus zhangzhouensis]